MALVGSGVVLFNVLKADPNLIPVAIAFVCYLVTLAIPVIAYGRTSAWFHPLIFTVLWWGMVRDVLPRIGIFANGLEYHQVASEVTPADVNSIVAFALLLTVVGYLALYCGYWMAPNVRLPRLQFSDNFSVTGKVVATGAVSLIALGVLASEAGGLGSLMLQRGLPSDMRVQAQLGGHWHFLVGLLKTACLTWLALKPRDWRRPLFIFSFALALFIDFAATGSRGGVILPIIIAVSIHSLYNRAMPYGKSLLVGLLGVVMVGVLGQFREGSRGAAELADVQLETGIVIGLMEGWSTITSYAGERDGFFGILARVPEEVDLLWGKSYLSIPAAPIPRALWSDKPEAAGKLNAIHIFNNPDTAVPPGNIGEAYWNFHVPGVLAVMFVFGVVLRWLARLYEQNGGAAWVSVIYVYTLFHLQPNTEAFYDWLHAVIPGIAFLIFFQGFPRRWGAGSV